MNDMTTRNLVEEPIRTITEWKSILFPNFHDEEQNTDETPSEIAVKWATRAVKSLPNTPIKPSQ